MTLTDAQLAAGLINTRSLPPGLGRVMEQSQEARAYHELTPYPKHWFRDWKEEDRGPLPRCLPIAKGIVRKGAKWLFGKPLAIAAPANPALETLLRETWQGNRMETRARAIAEKAALEGGVALKFAFDPAQTPQVRIQALSLASQARLYYHPHDCDRLLMARVQFPYFDGARGKTFWYREEWTAEQEVHYLPVDASQMYGVQPDTYEGWQVESAAANPFGVIPLTHVRNLETDDQWGAGDLWDLYRVLDRIHLTYHLMDRSNQFDSEVNPIFIDADLDDDDVDRPLQPGQGQSLVSREGGESARQAKVAFRPAGNALRPAMMEYARDLRKQVNACVGSVDVDQSEFTNKGNLTVAVLEQLYQPLIEATDDKRRSYGEAGLVPFFAALAMGLQRVGVPLGVTDKEETYCCSLQWGDYFERSEDEKAARTARIKEQEFAGYVPHGMAVAEIAEMERRVLKDVEQGLAAEPPPVVDAAGDPSVKEEAATGNQLRGIGGKDSA